MSQNFVENQRGIIFQGPSGHAELTWNSAFADKWNAKFSKAQRYIDMEVLRGCEPYVPLRTGMLVMSGILGTVVGNGTVSWIAPYARRQYYLPRKPGSQTGPLRGPYWFARWKPVGGAAVIAGAQAIMAEDK